MLIGILIFVSALSIVTAAIMTTDREVQRAYGYMLCEIVGGSLSRYYSFLSVSDLNTPSHEVITAPFLRIDSRRNGGLLETNIHFIYSNITCKPRRVSG